MIQNHEPSLAEVQSSLEMDNEDKVFNMASISIMMKDGSIDEEMPDYINFKR